MNQMDDHYKNEVNFKLAELKNAKIERIAENESKFLE